MRIWIVLLVSALCAAASAQQSVYSDQFDNGWANWSWATTNASASSPVHGGTKSLAVTVTGAWQAAYFHSAGIDITQVQAISFWIHGGGSAHNLAIQATRNGVAQPAAPVPVPVNAWGQVVMTTSQLGVAGATDFDGFWIQDVSGAAAPAYYLDDIQLDPVPPPTEVFLDVDADSAIRRFTRGMFGMNAAIWDSAFPTPATQSLLFEAGLFALRYPGGSASDEYHWQTNTSLNNAWTWANGFDRFLAATRKLSPLVMVTANYGTGTPQEAAAWCAYAKAKKAGARLWEVGNEVYGGWETDNHARPHDPYTYANEFVLYRQAIKAADPEAQVGAVIDLGEDSWANYTDHPATNSRTGLVHNGWNAVLLSTLASLGVVPDFVSYHQYPASAGFESDPGLLNSSGRWANDIPSIRQNLLDYLGPASARTAIYVTENNCVAAGPGKQSVSLVNGLYLADSMASLMRTEARGYYWWDLRNAQETGYNMSPALYGWRQYGDYGVVSPGNDRYPSFYALKLMKLFVQAGDLVLPASSSYPGLSVHAVRRSGRDLLALVVNKHPTADLNGTLRFAGFVPAVTAIQHRFGKPNDEAARLGLSSGRDITTTGLALGSTSPTLVFPSYSVTVIHLTPALPSRTRRVKGGGSKHHLVEPDH